MRWWWWGACVLAGCWRPNPLFLGGVPADTTGEGSTDASSGSGAAMSSGTDTTTTGASDSTTAPVSGTGTATSDSTSTTTTDGTTGDPAGSSGTTGGPTPEARCQLAAGDGDAVPYVDMEASCEAAKWTFTYPLNSEPQATICPSNNKGTGQILKQATPTGDAGVVLGKSLQTGPPWVGAEGIIQGEFLEIALTGASHPCFVARLDNTGPDGALLAQVFVRYAGQPDNVQIFPTPAMMDANEIVIPHGELTPIALPIPEKFVGAKIDVVLVVLKENEAVGVPQAALWERPRIIEAGP